MPIDGNSSPTNPVFWQNLAAEHIYNSADRRTASVEALKAVISWAFTIFSLGGFALTLFGQLKDFDQNALIAFGIAFFLLTLAYYVASRAQFPSVEKFKLGDSRAIADAYSNTVRLQAVTFRWAAAFTGLGFFFFASGLLIQFGTVKQNSKLASDVISEIPFIKATVEKRGDTTYVPVTINWQKSQPLTLMYIKLSSAKGSASLKETPLLTQVLHTDSTGAVFCSLRLAEKDSVQNLIIRTITKQKSVKDTTIERTISIRLPVTR